MSRVYATVFQPGQESVTLNVSKEKKKNSCQTKYNECVFLKDNKDGRRSKNFIT